MRQVFIENVLTTCPQSISNEQSVLGFWRAVPFGLAWFLFQFNVAARRDVFNGVTPQLPTLLGGC